MTPGPASAAVTSGPASAAVTSGPASAAVTVLLDLALDLALDGPALTRAVVDVESVSGNEARLAGLVEAALRGCAHLQVFRDGNNVVARTELGRPSRVLLGGHLDTVPTAENLPSTQVGDTISGCGTADMKSSLAVMLRLAASLPEPNRDLTYVFYDCEEIEATRNGLAHLVRTVPERLVCDLAILMEPTLNAVEAGCQGTLRVNIRVPGVRAHSARSWKGVNAIQEAAPLLQRLRDYVPRQPWVDGCQYHEGLQAVGISGGVSGNVVPDACTVLVNHRFAPDRTSQEALAHVREVFEGYEVELTDAADGARPGLDRQVTQEFLAFTGTTAVAKLGWTDVARFSALGVPALNYGPGDPLVAHMKDEAVSAEKILECEAVLRRWLT